ncbi:hypothetical protein MKQ70_03080 [Chitinophaga sedimenti]|uniref:hypothetical protein n=1 Tax=Chitinophaga sedimenti TaxID=2033606 RepID=UPI002006A5ED|nr:hypothetical protein [Chitinophaga sedimenti]MCK7554047.1 hypothetical protein [Chitinophaga sedimenti]
MKNRISRLPNTKISTAFKRLLAGNLAVLLNKELPVPRLQEAKDIHLFMAFTGYAYKYTLNLTPDNIAKFFDGEDWIVKNRKDTVPRKRALASTCKGNTEEI